LRLERSPVAPNKTIVSGSFAAADATAIGVAVGAGVRARMTWGEAMVQESGRNFVKRKCNSNRLAV
jgi:hypothetical protein